MVVLLGRFFHFCRSDLRSFSHLNQGLCFCYVVEVLHDCKYTKELMGSWHPPLLIGPDSGSLVQTMVQGDFHTCKFGLNQTEKSNSGLNEAGVKVTSLSQALLTVTQFSWTTNWTTKKKTITEITVLLERLSVLIMVSYTGLCFTITLS